MRPVRGPTIQATVRPAEAFAGFGAILVLDPNARAYSSRDLVAYFDAMCSAARLAAEGRRRFYSARSASAGESRRSRHAALKADPAAQPIITRATAA